MSLRDCEGCEGEPNCADPCPDCDDSWPVSFRPTAAPSTTAPTSDSPTALPTTAPSVSPTPRPLLNTVDDCGQHHIRCDGQLGAPYTGGGISCPAQQGDPTGRCVCTGPYHCRGTEARGPCSDVRDHCFERGITASPTAKPTTSLPTLAPTQGPSVAPTSSPTATYPTDGMGRPIFPTDAAGNEMSVCSSSIHPAVTVVSQASRPSRRMRCLRRHEM